MHCLINRLAMTILIISLSASTMCHAAIEISSSDAGWYKNNGSNNRTSQNYIVQVNSDQSHRNFFVFDLTGVSTPILSATLRLDNPTLITNAVPSTYTLYDVSTDISSLLTVQSNATGIYADLGTGVPYGSVSVGSSINPGVIEIALNGDALSAMNATSGMFVLGGALSVSGSASPARLFAYTGAVNSRTLVLEVEQPVISPNVGIVPEPVSAVVWAAIALVGSVGISFRKRKTLFSSC